MLKSCAACGRIHDSKIKCQRKAAPRKREADRLRNLYLWQRKRDAIRRRDLDMCRLCFDQGEVNSSRLSVHHIVPLEEDPTLAFDDDNLITLCDAHHEDAERGAVSRSKLRSLASEPLVD